MCSTLIINEQTKRELAAYQVGGGNLILQGPDHVGKTTLCHKLTEALLGKDYQRSCDYYLIEAAPEKGIKMEDIRQLLEETRYSAMGRKKVCVIQKAGTLRVDAQNALLKILEDGNENHLFILLTNQPLLSTIHSRCTTISVRSCINQVSVDPVFDLFMEGRPGVKFLYEGSEFHQYMLGFHEVLLGGRTEAILSYVGALKEKDPTYFYDTHTKEEVQLFLTYLLNGYVSGILGVALKGLEYQAFTPLTCSLEFIHSVQEHREMLAQGRYSKNDFLNLLFAIKGKEKGRA